VIRYSGGNFEVPRLLKIDRKIDVTITSNNCTRTGTDLAQEVEEGTFFNM
jgi:hypothetical protein